jgi:hypothetical protein
VVLQRFLAIPKIHVWTSILPNDNPLKMPVCVEAVAGQRLRAIGGKCARRMLPRDSVARCATSLANHQPWT